AWSAFAQTDLKRMFAYSSINHLGYCLLGIFLAARLSTRTADMDIERAAVLNGVVLQMFNHGLTAASLFCLLGWLEQRSGGLRCMADFGGLRKVAPVFCGLMGIATFASLGLPGLNGFVAEVQIFIGAFAIWPWLAALALLGLIVTAALFLGMLQRIFFGQRPPVLDGFTDLTRTEIGILAALLALVVLIGVWPAWLLDMIGAGAALTFGGG
ncbi:MAG: NADH-quinone oxidoreductase subunit M, partial [Verrucomicrobiae bacterium]|nr:NADH-quinone oxidoreductase subunit M [Verrucomicrobiae bacterium]